MGKSALVAGEVLADQGCPVACRIQPRGHIVLLVAIPPVYIQAPHPKIAVGPSPGVVGVLASHSGGSRRAANRIGDEGVLEGHPLILQETLRLWHVLEVVFTHVISEDEDYIGLGGER